MKEGTRNQQTPGAGPRAQASADDRNLIVLSAPDELPPVLVGHVTPQVRARAESFYDGIAELFERWVARRPSPHTQRVELTRFRGVCLAGRQGGEDAENTSTIPGRVSAADG